MVTSVSLKEDCCARPLLSLSFSSTKDRRYARGTRERGKLEAKFVFILFQEALQSVSDCLMHSKYNGEAIEKAREQRN